MVPVALRPARDVPGPSRLWSDPGYGWNRLALPPPVGRSRASLLDEPGRGVAWQRPPLVLPRRRFRHGTEESTRSGRPVRRGAPREPEHSNTGVLTPGSGRILRHDQCALCAPAKGARKAAAYQALAADEGTRPNQKVTGETSAPSRLKRSSLDERANGPLACSHPNQVTCTRLQKSATGTGKMARRRPLLIRW